jgi:hypothetical protein
VWNSPWKECEGLRLPKARMKDRRGADHVLAAMARLNPGQARDTSD